MHSLSFIQKDKKESSEDLEFWPLQSSVFELSEHNIKGAKNRIFTQRYRRHRDMSDIENDSYQAETYTEHYYSIN